MYVGNTALYKWLCYKEHKLSTAQAYLIAETAFKSDGQMLWSDTWASRPTLRVCMHKGWLVPDELGLCVTLTDWARGVIATHYPNLTYWTVAWVKAHGIG